MECEVRNRMGLRLAVVEFPIHTFKPPAVLLYDGKTFIRAETALNHFLYYEADSMTAIRYGVSPNRLPYLKAS
jgi:hypothetical protein